MALFLHHIGGKRMNVLIAVWNKFTLIWNKLKIFARGFLYGSIVLSPCIENQPQNGFQETCVCAYVSVHIYAYILPRNYVWVHVWEHTHTHTHTHFWEHWEWFLRSTWGLVTCPAWVGLVAYLPPCPLTRNHKSAPGSRTEAEAGWTALHTRCWECSELRIRLPW